MRKLFLVLAFACALVGAPSATAAYDDTACRTTGVSWANDPCAGRQWGHVNVRAPEAWAVTRGAGVTVAVVDTGVDFNHPDLAANLVSVAGSDVTRNTAYHCPGQAPGPKSSNAVAQDDHGHGTHVAGTIAAVTGNGLGVAGVAPDARILPVKVLDAEGSGSDADVARGICFAADHGAKVINLSLGYDPAGSIIVTALGNDTNGAIDYAHSRGATVVIAAGNDTFPACSFPASHDKALCVGSVDRRDVKSWFSNFGTEVGVVAPGGLGSVFCEDDEDIWSTVLPGSSLDCGDDGYDSLAGTSMATPHAAAVAALVTADFGAGATPDAVISTLKATADDVGSPGLDPVYGYGRVNALRAVTQ
jgi:subtilisin family serine protease